MGGERSVLVLGELTDDERSNIERDCESSNFDLTWVTSAETASAKLGSGEFDTLLVHLQTPGAARVCLNARSKLARGRFPIIALSEEATDTAFARAFRAGADDLLRIGASGQVSHRLDAVPRPSQLPGETSRGEALIVDPDRGRSDVMERVLGDAGYRVESVRDELAAKLHLGRPSIKLVVADAAFGDAGSMVEASKRKGSRAVWVVRTRPDQIVEMGRRLAKLKNASVVSAYGPPDDVLFEANRLMSGSTQDSRTDPRLLHGTTVIFRERSRDWEEYGFSYNVSANGLFVRTLALPESDDLEVELRPPGRDSTVLLTGSIVWRRLFGPAQNQSTPPGFGLQFSGGELNQWAEAFREAYADFFGNEIADDAAPQKDLRKPARSGIPMPGAIKRTKSGRVQMPQPIGGGLLTKRPAAPAAEPKPRAKQQSTGGRDTLSSVEEMLTDVLGGGTSEPSAPVSRAPGSKPLTMKGSFEVEEDSDAPADAEPSATPAGPPARLQTHRKPAALTEQRNPPAPRMVDVSVPARGRAGAPMASVPPSRRPKPSGAPRAKLKATLAGIAPDDPAAKRAAGLSRPPFGAPRTEAGQPGPVQPEAIGDLDLASEPPEAPDEPAGDSLDIEAATALDSLELQSEPPDPPDDGEAAPERPDSLEFAFDPPRPEPAASDAAAAEESPAKQTPSMGPPASEPRANEAARQEPPATDPQPFGTTTQTFGAFLAHRRLPGQAAPPLSQPPAEVRITDPPVSGDDVDGLELLPTDPPPSGKNTTEISRAELLPDELHALVFEHGKGSARSQHAATADAAERWSATSSDQQAQGTGASNFPSPSPEDDLDDAIDESVVPKQKRGVRTALTVFAVLVALGAGGFFALSLSATDSKPTATAPAAVTAAAQTATATAPVAATTPPAASQTAAPAPSASASAASVEADEPATEATEETPEVESPAAATPDKPATALDPEYGYLFVESSLDTNVYVHGNLTGKTNSVLTTHCGTRFIRLGTDPGHWQSEGLPTRIFCQKMNRVKIK